MCKTFEFGLIVASCRDFFTTNSNSFIVFRRRIANIVAYRFARTSYLFSSLYWIEPPFFVLPFLICFVIVHFKVL